jgi:hypothetical protein
VVTWNRSGGRPDASKSSLARSAMRGVISEGLRTTALPASHAITASPSGIVSGTFHGETMPTTPRGV